MHAVYNEKTAALATAYANVFMILFGMATGERRERIRENLLHNAEIPPITTPYMQAYRLACLCELGDYASVYGEILKYWGGMLDRGATSFWETFDEKENSPEIYAMYGRPFGKSFCHIWGASPLYLIPRYFFGIRSVKVPKAVFELRPQVDYIRGCSIRVPLAEGFLEVEERDGKISVYSSAMSGKLYLNGRTETILPGIRHETNYREEKK